MNSQRSVKTAAGGPNKSIPLLMPKLRCFTLAVREGLSYPEAARQDLRAILRQRKACLHWTYVGRDGPAAVWAGGEREAGGPGGFQVVGGIVGMPFGPGDGMGGPPPNEEFMNFMMGAGGPMPAFF